MTTSSGTSTRTQVRLTGGLPVRFARPGAPGPGEPVPSPARTATAGRTARTRLNVDDAWCEALSASAPAPAGTPAARRMAQESGDHPQAAAERMRWVRRSPPGRLPATCEPGPDRRPIPGAAAPGAQR